MVSPGAEVGDGASVEPLSVVPDGAQVPYNVVARGNPACGGGKTESVSVEFGLETVFELCKLVWLFADLYIICAMLATSWNFARYVASS
mmetsp:Transcript_5770/g.8857  ORF Transcript_5770/g.8857 Transcript_5770/m.8857 type:complete len:89 (+) Transcript_5770:667-933(+)